MLASLLEVDNPTVILPADLQDIVTSRALVFDGQKKKETIFWPFYAILAHFRPLDQMTGNFKVLAKALVTSMAFEEIYTP